MRAASGCERRHGSGGEAGGRPRLGAPRMHDSIPSLGSLTGALRCLGLACQHRRPSLLGSMRGARGRRSGGRQPSGTLPHGVGGCAASPAAADSLAALSHVGVKAAADSRVVSASRAAAAAGGVCGQQLSGGGGALQRHRQAAGALSGGVRRLCKTARAPTGPASPLRQCARLRARWAWRPGAPSCLRSAMLLQPRLGRESEAAGSACGTKMRGTDEGYRPGGAKKAAAQRPGCSVTTQSCAGPVPCSG